MELSVSILIVVEQNASAHHARVDDQAESA